MINFFFFSSLTTLAHLTLFSCEEVWPIPCRLYDHALARRIQTRPCAGPFHDVWKTEMRDLIS
jgi:hypothetical protein